MHPRKRPRKNASAMRLVGAVLAQFRTSAHLTQNALAQRVGLDCETIASIEQGRRPLKPDYAEILDRVLDTKGALSVAVENMPEIDLIPAWAEQYMDLERDALALSFYENQVVPGLLQTETYARAVFDSRIPTLGPDMAAIQTASRMKRQEILARQPPPCLSFVIWEAVLRTRLGGQAVFQEQLRHLRACANLPGLALQVLPLALTTHPALDGPFVLVETPDHQHLAYSETQRGSQLIADPDEVSILAQRYAMLRTQALNSDESKGLLDQLVGEQ